MEWKGAKGKEGDGVRMEKGEKEGGRLKLKKGREGERKRKGGNPPIHISCYATASVRLSVRHKSMFIKLLLSHWLPVLLDHPSSVLCRYLITRAVRRVIFADVHRSLKACVCPEADLVMFVRTGTSRAKEFRWFFFILGFLGFGYFGIFFSSN